MPTEQWRKANLDKVRASRRKWYHANAEHAKQEIKRRQREIREWIIGMKEKLKCETCGEPHFATLDFHHKDPLQKDIAMSKVHLWGWSKEHIMIEMKKCSVLCSNCHRKLHWEEKQNRCLV